MVTVSWTRALMAGYRIPGPIGMEIADQPPRSQRTSPGHAPGPIGMQETTSPQTSAFLRAGAKRIHILETTSPKTFVYENTHSLLRSCGIKHKVFWSSGNSVVYISNANQLFSEKRFFDSSVFRNTFREEYKGWEAHHIVEDQDLIRLGIDHRFPPYEKQTCVLLPPGGHRGRINARLRTLLPIGIHIMNDDVLESYSDAYSTLGNYCGSSESAIYDELMAIVEYCLSTGTVQER